MPPTPPLGDPTGGYPGAQYPAPNYPAPGQPAPGQPVHPTKGPYPGADAPAAYPGTVDPAAYPAAYPGTVDPAAYPAAYQAAYPGASPGTYPPVYGQTAPGLSGPAGPPPRKSRTGLIVLIVLLVVVLAGGAVAAGLLLRPQPVVPPPPVPTQDPGPVEAVSGFLQAVAQGRASDALAYLSRTPTNTTFLNDQALAAMAAADLMTVGEVTEPDWQPGETTATVTADLTIDQQTELIEYYVSATADGWRLTPNNLATLILAGHLPPGLAVTLNGITVSDADLKAGFPVFPGSYDLCLPNPFLTLAVAHFVVSDQADLADLPYDGNVEFAPDAGSRLTSVAQTKLDDCLAAHELTPVDCGFEISGLDGSGTPNPDTARFILLSSDLASADWQMDSASYLAASAAINIKVQLDVRDTRGNRYRGTDTVSAVEIDFADPDNPRVIFRSQAR